MDKLPGFIDLQINGFMGVDFSGRSLTTESFRQTCRRLLQKGLAGFCPTVITSPTETLRQNLSLIASVMDESEFQGRLLGIHLEGPFISRASGAIGAHNPQWVLDPSIETFDRFQQWAQGRIRILTLAAESPAADALARHVSDQGVCVCLGHQLATGADLQRLVEAGAKALTHLGNSLPALLPRHENPIWAGLANDALTATMITDGHHLPPDVIRCFIRCKGVDRIAVISDAATSAGLPPGTYEDSFGTIVLEESGKLHAPERGCLAGSSATMLTCMNHLAGLDLMTPQDLLTVGFTNPLKLIALTRADVDTTEILRYDGDARRFEPLG